MTHTTILAHQPETNLTQQIHQDFNNLRRSNFQKKQTLTLQTLTNFSLWLQTNKLSKASVKNYVSDTRSFLNYLKRLPHKETDFHYYFLFLQQKATPLSTFNRKISSLRRFARFLHLKLALPDFSSRFKRIPQDPIENLIANFKSHLKSKKLKNKTIINYISDIKHYLAWAANESE